MKRRERDKKGQNLCDVISGVSKGSAMGLLHH